jgi:two-component system, cell cycle sensor histidine kinase and response regulator CckA
VNLNAVITDFTKILHRALRENIIVKTHFDPSLNTILGEAGQIEQILLNLALNAQDAMPDGGTLFLETSNVQMKHSLIINNEEMQSGDYVMLAVSDTGGGIDSSILPQIFEPFFTTKEAGKGTGLGLSTVYGIVKQHNGHVSVYSELHKGTTFKMYFPVYHLEDEQQVVKNTHQPSHTVQDKKIFVVEDQEQILELVSEVLSDEGFIVSTASTVVEAMKKFQLLSGTIDLFISDVILPDGNGRQLYDDLTVLQPDLKVLFMSSYTEDIITHHKLLTDGVGFISKPFSISDFISKVEAMVA